MAKISNLQTHEIQSILAHFRQETPQSVITDYPPYDPNLIIQLALRIITTLETSENYAIIEQLIEAYLAVGQTSEAEQWIKKLSVPTTSPRLQLLNAMVLESQGKLKEALIKYGDLVNGGSSVSAKASKRIALLQQAKGDTLQTIKTLASHVDTFMQDTEAWLMLADEYIQSGMYQQALYCLEEVVVLKPTDHLVILKFADMLYSVGEHRLSLKYYCAVLNVGECLAAWIGIKQSCENLLQGVGVDLADDEIISLHQIACKQMLTYYEKDNKMYALVLKWVNQSNIA